MSSNRLLILAAEIRRAHAGAQEALAAARTAIKHAIRCGERLIEAKSQLAHGQWLPWIGPISRSVRGRRRSTSV